MSDYVEKIEEIYNDYLTKISNFDFKTYLILIVIIIYTFFIREKIIPWSSDSIIEKILIILLLSLTIPIIINKIIEKNQGVSYYFYVICDYIFNKNMYLLSGFLVFMLIAFYLFISIINPYITKINPFNIKTGKYSQILVLLFISLIIFVFYFFIYRNINSKNEYKLKNQVWFTDAEYETINNDNTAYVDSIKKPIYNLLISFSKILLLIFLPVILISLLFTSINNNHSLFNITKLIILLILIFVFLAILVKMINLNLIECDTNKSLYSNVLCFIYNFVLFIPCLINIIIDEIHKDIKATPSPVYILFFILLFLVCLFFFLPLLFNFILTMNKHDLLEGKGPYYLNNLKNIGIYQHLDKNYISKSKDNYKFKLFDDNNDYNLQISSNNNIITNNNKYSYSISFYLYLNPQSNNTNLAYNKESELFNYGNKPVILYNGYDRTLIIKSKTLKNEGSQMDTIFKTKDIKYQKWLYFVINYENNIIDVFIDGKLVGSKKNIPLFFKDDKITIGEDNGIHGSIKNIYYFDQPRPESNIELLYDLTKNK